MRVLLLALSILATHPAVARADVCSPDYLLSAQSMENRFSRLDIIMAAVRDWDTPPPAWPAEQDWGAIRDQSVRQVAGCASVPATIDSKTFRESARGAWKAFEETVKGAVRAAQPTTPVLAPLLGPGGAPTPQYLQVGLSQVITAGQPGTAATLAGNLGRTQQSSLSLSALVVQPTQPSDPAAAEAASPQLSSFDGGFYYTTRPTVHTFIAWVTSDDGLSEALGTHAWVATTVMHGLLARKVATAPDQLRQAVVYAVGVAGARYADSSRRYIQEHYVATEEARNRARYFDLAMRLRGTRNAEFLPELPDLLSLSVAASGALGQAQQARKPSFGGSGTLSLAASALPSESFTTWDTGKIPDTLGFVGDLAIGATATFPSGSDKPPTTVVTSAIGRVSRHAGDGDGDGTGDETSTVFSGGGSIVLSVPFGSGIDLIGSYTFRYVEGLGWISTSGLTVAKSIAN